MTVISNAMDASWLEVSLTLGNIRASKGSTRKAPIRTNMEAGGWAHTSTCTGTTAGAFVESYWLGYYKRRQPAFMG